MAMESDDIKGRLPEERRFKNVLVSACVAVASFVLAFVATTLVKALQSPQDITSNWFVAWGTWGGGLAAAAAFLIAAFSISVASAHARFDRREAAEIREDNDMAQARLLSIYKVEDGRSLPSLPTFRIENRSKDLFFDVTVPYVDSPYGPDNSLERRTAELVAQENRLHEHIPTAEQLTPYRDHNEDEVWFTLVTVHTRDASEIEFEVRYTDANGRRWSQQLGGTIERVTTTEAVQVRPPDRFQPPQQISLMSAVEGWRLGARFTKNLPPLQTDEQFLEVLGARDARNWQRIERTSDVTVVPVQHADGSLKSDEGEVSVTFSPKAPPLWEEHFLKPLTEAGLRSAGGRSQYDQTVEFRFDEQANRVEFTRLFDDAIAYANEQFEQNELAAARRALVARGHVLE